jgi:hypothetical protein
MPDRLRDMFWAPGGKRIGGTNYVGIREQDIPAAGQDFASFLRNDIQLPGDAGKRFRMEVLTLNLPPGSTLRLNEDGSGSLTNGSPGTWGGTYRLWVDGIASTANNYSLGPGIAPFTIIIGTPFSATGDAPFVVSFGADGAIVGWLNPSCEITGDAPWLVGFGAAGSVLGRVADTAAFALPVRRIAYSGRLMPTKVTPLDVDGSDDIAFDFGRELRAGEWLDAGTIQIQAEVRYGGADAAAGAIFVGAPGVLGQYVLQRLQGPLAGLTYLLRCRVRTAPTGRELLATAYVPVRRMGALS